MSYVRFLEADVYVYLDVNGYVCCCGCWLNKDWKHYSTDSILEHLREHVAAGHEVPQWVFKDIEADRDRIEEYIADKLPRRPTTVASVPCPKCHALIDMPCMTATKRARKSYHTERQTLWLEVNKTNTETNRSTSDRGGQLVFDDENR